MESYNSRSWHVTANQLGEVFLRNGRERGTKTPSINFCPYCGKAVQIWGLDADGEYYRLPQFNTLAPRLRNFNDEEN
jgi:hypothetical protein